jgi:hypothetical protein
MSTRVTQHEPVAGRPSRGLGLAAAALAIVVALAIAFTLSQGNGTSPSDVQPAHPRVEDSRRVINEHEATIVPDESLAVDKFHPGHPRAPENRREKIDALRQQETELDRPEWDNRIP